ncbi:MAG: hypothetical protein HYX46_12740 [Betaproteobacteria bacterium]|nr:hypothetical protein [Betaproteobacteria bacterium]
MLSLAMILFAQIAVTFAACDVIRSTPRHALATVSHEAPERTCNEQDGNANLCLAHCEGEDLSLDKPQVKVHALFLQSVLAVRVPPAPLKYMVVCAEHPGAWADPPPRILFRSLLI